MARRPKASDEVLVELFLDMLAAERGAGENTLSAYRRDLDDLSAHLRCSEARTSPRRRPMICADLSRAWPSAASRRRRWRGAFGDPPTLPFSLRGR